MARALVIRAGGTVAVTGAVTGSDALSVGAGHGPLDHFFAFR